MQIRKQAHGRMCREGEIRVKKSLCSFVRPLGKALVAVLLVPLIAWAGSPEVERTGAAAGSGSGAAVAPLAACPSMYGSAPIAPLAPALANAIRERVRKQVGGSVTSVCRTPFGLYEVVVDSEIIYVDERAHYLLTGNVFDLRTQENLTAMRKENATRIDFGSLPLALAVKTVRGNGSRVLAVFEDPNCPYCKRFEKEISTLTDATIYTFLYPILSRDASLADDSYPKSKAIWCAPDRSLAWSQVMLEGKHLAAAPEACQHPLEEILALGQKLHITGTPTLVFTDGRRAPGAIPLERVEQMLSEAARSSVSQ